MPIPLPLHMGTFKMICSTILHLPPGSQAAVLDVVEAYRTIPLKSSQWPGTVVCILQSEFAIDKCLAFGCSSSAGIYGNLADTSTDIFRAKGIGPVSKWVDDFHFLLRSHPPNFPVQSHLPGTPLLHHTQQRLQKGRRLTPIQRPVAGWLLQRI